MPVPDPRVEMQIDGVWTDVSSDVYFDTGVTHARGRSGEGARVDPATVALKLKSPNGKYSPRNPLSPNFGLIGRNTPVRASAGGADTALHLSGNARASTPDHTSLDIAGDIDVRAELTPATWAGDFVNVWWEVMGKYVTTGNQRSWRLLVGNAGNIQFTWSPDGTNLVGSLSTANVPHQPGQRGAIRATLDANNGAGGNTVTFYTAPTLAGPWTQLGAPVVASGVTGLFNSSAPLEIGDISSVGFANQTLYVHAAEVRSGIGGTVVANPTFSTQTVGTPSFTDGAGRLWTLANGAEITDHRIRFVVEVPEWSPRFTVSGTDMYVPIQGGGILRRLGQGQKALDSTLRRRIPTYSPLAYWPMEEGATATQAYSPIAGVGPMAVTDMSFASASDLGGSGPLPTLGDNARFFGGVRPGANGQWQVELVYNLDALPASLTTMLLVRTTGSTPRILVQIQTTNVKLVGQDAAGDEVWFINLTPPDFVGQWNRLQVMHSTSGGTITAKIGWVTIGQGGQYGQTTYSGTAGHVTSVEAQPGTGLQGMGLGHVSVFETADMQAAYAFADHGFSGETAGARLTRLATEEGVPFALVGSTADQTPMGPQRPDTLLNLFAECEAADGGILYEDRNQIGLVYRKRASLYNQQPALVLPYSRINQPFEPVDDDSRIRNDVTRTRPGGSSARVVRDSGPLSVQAPPLGVGTYDESVSVSVDTDEQLEQIAGWAMHLGTWDEARYKQLRILLHKHPDLIPVVSQLDVGSIVRITDLPAYWPPGPIDLLVEGYREDLTGLTWDLTLNCSPAGPWTVGVVESSTLGRPDTDGCTLTGALTTTATSVAVTSSPGPRWIDSATYAAMFPFDVTVGGEVMRVTACTGTGLAQTFTVTRSINGVVKTHAAGAALSLTNPMRAAL